MLLLAPRWKRSSPPALREHESPTQGTSTMPYSLGEQPELLVVQVESDPTLLSLFVRDGMVKNGSEEGRLF